MQCMHVCVQTGTYEYSVSVWCLINQTVRQAKREKDWEQGEGKEVKPGCRQIRHPVIAWVMVRLKGEHNRLLYLFCSSKLVENREQTRKEEAVNQSGSESRIPFRTLCWVLHVKKSQSRSRPVQGLVPRLTSESLFSLLQSFRSSGSGVSPSRLSATPFDSLFPPHCESNQRHQAPHQWLAVAWWFSFHPSY